MKNGQISDAKGREPVLIGSVSAGFSARELLVVVTVLGILILVALQLVHRSRARARGRALIQGIYCLNNARQLANSVILYAADNNDWLPPNSDDGKIPVNWVRGSMKNRQDATNILYLTDPKFAKLAPYCGFSASVYKCPADTSEVDINGILFPRVRTFSMNHAAGTKLVPPLAAVNGPWLDGTSHHTAGQTWQTYGRLADMIKPAPGKLWLFLDEDQNSVNDAAFAINMTSPTKWVDWPGTYHDYCASISFADGHSEAHQWLDQRTKLRGQEMAENNDARNQPGNQDIQWLQERTSAKIATAKP